MKLTEYISSSNLTAASFAELIGVTPATVSYWLSGDRKPDVENCKLIEFATGGAVRCEELRPEFNWDFIRGNRKVAA